MNEVVSAPVSPLQETILKISGLSKSELAAFDANVHGPIESLGCQDAVACRQLLTSLSPKKIMKHTGKWLATYTWKVLRYTHPFFPEPWILGGKHSSWLWSLLFYVILIFAKPHAQGVRNLDVGVFRLDSITPSRQAWGCFCIVLSGFVHKLEQLFCYRSISTSGNTPEN